MGSRVPDNTPVILMGKIGRLSDRKTVVWQRALDGVLAIDAVPPSR